jgi:hypothetical protein
MNIIGQPEFSLEYLPEPWWGNDGNSPLNSVIINYNPGCAEDYKHFTHPPIKILHNYPNYSSFINSQVKAINNHFSRTNNWHWHNRAKVVFDTCKRLGVQLNGSVLCNHLSIELIPWHTEDIGNIQPYIKNNLQQIYSHNIVFAANESRRIVNNRLKNKVIVRSCFKTISIILKQIKAAGLDDYHPITKTTTHTNTGNGSCFKFYFDKLPDVEFICIWGKYSRNDFPPAVDMNQIL